MKLTEEEKRLMNNGDPQPDIVREAQAALFVLIVFVCAILVCGAVVGVFWLINEIIKSLC